MRAVNLIPADLRRGAGGLAGRSGGIVYVLTGGLAVLVALGVVYALAVRSVADHKSTLAEVTAQTLAVNEESQALAPYVEVAALSAEKVQEVSTLAKQRFDWPSAMAQLAYALPSDVTFTGFTASVPGAGVSGQAPTAVTSPDAGTTFVLSGCARVQDETADVLVDLARVPGVTNVSLSNTIEHAKPSKKLSKKATEQAALQNGGGCGFVSFSLTLTYAASYTVPDSKLPTGSSSGAQTVSTRSGAHTGTPHTAASRHSKGATG